MTLTDENDDGKLTYKEFKASILEADALQNEKERLGNLVEDAGKCISATLGRETNPARSELERKAQEIMTNVKPDWEALDNAIESEKD